ncbi:MAG: CHAD domain-containing protein [Candidatus Omnitrophota bacterium]|nr:CHAD domain-containing protein [Candidatus Omnitrophota bacterium]
MKPAVFGYNPYVIIEKYSNDMCAEFVGVRANRSIECLHRMRVASRRLRTSLWVYKTLFPAGKLSRWKVSLNGLARVLGKARDCDIHTKHLKTVLAHTRDTSLANGIRRLWVALCDERSRLQPRVSAALDMFCESGVREELQDFLRRRTLRVPDREELSRLAARRIRKRLEQFLSFAPYVHKPRQVRRLHQMRIAAKHVRYSLQICAPLYKKKKINSFIEAAYDIQHILGDVHDRDVWITTLPRYGQAATDPLYRQALGSLRARCVRMRESSYVQFVRMWRKQEKENIWEKLESCLRRACRL